MYSPAENSVLIDYTENLQDYMLSIKVWSSDFIRFFVIKIEYILDFRMERITSGRKIFTSWYPPASFYESLCAKTYESQKNLRKSQSFSGGQGILKKW